MLVFYFFSYEALTFHGIATDFSLMVIFNHTYTYPDPQYCHVQNTLANLGIDILGDDGSLLPGEENLVDLQPKGSQT